MPRDHRHAAVQDYGTPPAESDGQRPCSRGIWCSGYRIVPQGDGTSKREPGLSYQAFCQADTELIAGYLDEDQGLPAAWKRLEADIGDPARRGEMIRVPFGPRMLLSEYYDMLMRRVSDVLCCYEERVRTAARLTVADTKASSLHAVSHKTVTKAAGTLTRHLSALLALPKEPVFRHIPSTELKAATDPRKAGTPILELWQDAVVFANRDGMATVLAALSGAHAGLEIIDLHRRCLSALGEIAGHPELLDGVPCRIGTCGATHLERAEPPSDPDIPADHSRCPDCGDRMSLDTFRDWGKWYEAWAKSAGPLTCRRCHNGDCGECVYPGCECRAHGHQEAALRARLAA